jgi:hypothetical protein
MKRIITAAAVLLLGVSTAALAAEKGGASQMSPGHEMQGSGTTKGASELSPGDRMHDKGTVGKSKGASEYSPGDRMNDQRKK